MKNLSKWTKVIKYSGAGTELHGFTEWGSQSHELPFRVLTTENLFPSVFYLMSKQQPNAETAVIYTLDGIGYLFEKNLVDLNADMPDDGATARKAVDYIIQNEN